MRAIPTRGRWSAAVIRRLALAGLLLCAALVPDTWAQLRHGDEVVTVTGAKRVRIRSAPAFEKDGASSFIRWVARGTQLKRLAREGEWWKVALPEGGEAYISARYVKQEVARDRLLVKPTVLNVRKNPTTAADKIATVRRTDELLLVRESNNWYLALLPDGKRRGWIRADMVDRVRIGPAPKEPPPAAAPEPSRPEPKPKQPATSPTDSYQNGVDLAQEGRVDEAIAALTKAVEQQPDDGAAHFELAKQLQKSGREDDALRHFRAAVRGNPARPEARFFVEAILRARADTSEAMPAPDEDAPEASWTDAVLVGSGYLLPGLAVGSLLFLAVLGLIYRRRRAARSESTVYRRRKPDAGFDSVLKYAVEKRPLLRAVAEAERKRAELDEALSQQFETFDSETEAGHHLPEVASTEALMKRVEDLRQTIVSQEERAQVYAELVVLQNQKIQALDDEIDALKKLIKLDYDEAPEKGKSASKPKREGRGE